VKIKYLSGNFDDLLGHVCDSPQPKLKGELTTSIIRLMQADDVKLLELNRSSDHDPHDRRKKAMATP
jgi:hypothetical protein